MLFECVETIQSVQLSTGFPSQALNFVFRAQGYPRPDGHEWDEQLITRLYEAEIPVSKRKYDHGH